MTTQQLPHASHFESLFNQLTDPIVEFKLVDGEPIIVQANAAFHQVFCAGESVAGLPLNELIVPEEQREEAKNLDQRTADGKPNRAVIEVYPLVRNMGLRSTVTLRTNSVENDTSMCFSVSSVTTYAMT
jgi:PAS domain-containing protein